jgi:hypothetical protein
MVKVEGIAFIIATWAKGAVIVVYSTAHAIGLVGDRTKGIGQPLIQTYGHFLDR